MIALLKAIETDCVRNGCSLGCQVYLPEDSRATLQGLETKKRKRHISEKADGYSKRPAVDTHVDDAKVAEHESLIP